MRWIVRLVVVAGTACVLFIAAMAVLMFPELRIVFLGGTHSAKTTLPSGLTVKVQMAPVFMTHLAEYERRLVVCNGWILVCSRKWLITDWGGHRKLNLYRDRSGSIFVVDSIWMMEIIDGPQIRILDYREEEAAQLREGRWNCREERPGPLAKQAAPQSRYFKDWEYLGMFEFFTADDEPASSVRFGEFKFVPSARHGEVLCAYPSRG